MRRECGEPKQPHSPPHPWAQGPELQTSVQQVKCKPRTSQNRGRKTEKENQNPEKSMFTTMYTKSQGSGGCLPGNRAPVDRGSVHVDRGVCVYNTAYVNQFSTEWACRTPRSPECNLPPGQVSHGDIERGALRPHQEQTRALLFWGEPLHTYPEENTSGPFSTYLIHSINKWLAECVFF